MAEADLGAGMVKVGGSLALLQGDLLKLLWREEMPRQDATAL